MLKLGGIDICTDHVTIVADLYRKRGYRVRKRYVGESSIFPHKAMGSASLLIDEICANDHALIIDAAGKRPACSPGKGNNGQFALMQQKTEVRAVAVELADYVPQIIDAFGDRRGVRKAGDFHLAKST